MNKMRALCWSSMVVILVFAVNVERSGGTPTEGDIRLRGGYNATVGRVEIYHAGEWGTVCDDSWNIEDAQVVCRQLGLGGGIHMERAAFGEGTGRIWMDEVRCSGQETELINCRFQGWGQEDCGHNEDAGVICDGGGTPTEGDIRLQGGYNATAGRVEIYHAGEWGTVCDDSWSIEDAQVVCRQLGLGGGIHMERAAFGLGTGRIWMDEVRCSGQETELINCRFQGWGQEDCGHNEDAGVICDGDISNGQE